MHSGCSSGTASAAQNFSQQVLAPQSFDSPDDCSAQIPAAGLKPLYDFVQERRARQAELAACQYKSDGTAKIIALTGELRRPAPASGCRTLRPDQKDAAKRDACILDDRE